MDILLSLIAQLIVVMSLLFVMEETYHMIIMSIKTSKQACPLMDCLNSGTLQMKA